jgi:hypothetical protein
VGTEARGWGRDRTAGGCRRDESKEKSGVKGRVGAPACPYAPSRSSRGGREAGRGLEAAGWPYSRSNTMICGAANGAAQAVHQLQHKSEAGGFHAIRAAPWQETGGKTAARHTPTAAMPPSRRHPHCTSCRGRRGRKGPARFWPTTPTRQAHPPTALTSRFHRGKSTVPPPTHAPPPPPHTHTRTHTQTHTSPLAAAAGRACRGCRRRRSAGRPPGPGPPGTGAAGCGRPQG